MLVKNCECSNNINTGSGQAFGFYTDTDNSIFFPTLGNTNVFDSCFAEQNTSSSGLAGGFKIANVADSTVRDCISKENGIGILVTDSNSPQIALHNTFEDNFVLSNTISGIDDRIVNGDNAYVRNVSAFNGPAETTNFIDLPAGTPIITWSISSGLPFPIDPFANVSIVP